MKPNFSKLSRLNKLLIASNAFFIVLAVLALGYETPRHQREDALNALMSLERTEDLSPNHYAYRYIETAIQNELDSEASIDWAGIEWSRVSAMIRTHATTTTGKRYIVQLLLSPTESQQVKVERYEITDVTDQVSTKGL